MQQSTDPNQEKRVLAAVALSVLVLWVFQSFVFEPPPPPPVQEVESVAQISSDAAEPVPLDQLPDPPSALPEEDDSASPVAVDARRVVEVPVEPATMDRRWGEVNDFGVDRSLLTKWSNYGGTPTGIQIAAYQSPYELDWLPTWLLAGFKEGFSWGDFDMGWPNLPDTGAVDIVRGEDGDVLLPVGVDDNGIAEDIGYYEVTEGLGSLSFDTRRGDLAVSKRFDLPDSGYLLAYTVSFKNLGREPVELLPSIGVADRLVANSDRFGSQSEVWASVAEDVENLLPAHRGDRNDP